MIEGVKRCHLQIHGDENGSLIAIEEYTKVFPYPLKRMYYLFNTREGVVRGKHAHKKLKQLIVCVNGECKILLDNSIDKCEIILNSPDEAILIEKPMWREIRDLSKDCIVLVLASDLYDKEDYIYDYEEFISHK
jgi:dTDP-4-dehydrorhamnose 3,5-epimerase-like enzyme